MCIRRVTLVARTFHEKIPRSGRGVDPRPLLARGWGVDRSAQGGSREGSDPVSWKNLRQGVFGPRQGRQRGGDSRKEGLEFRLAKGIGRGSRNEVPCCKGIETCPTHNQNPSSPSQRSSLLQRD